jgi:hypothetical protein
MAMYNVPSALSFEYTIETLATNEEQSYTIAMAAGQYAASDALSALSASLDTHLTFTYDSKAYKFTLAVANSSLSSLALGTAAATWAYLYLKFSITTEGEYVSTYTSESIATLVHIYIAIDAFQCSSAIRLSKQAYPNIVARVPMVAAPGSKNVYTPIDPFFVDVRSPSISQVIVTLRDDDCDVLNLQGSPWALTLYDYVYLTKVNRPGDSISTAYTRMNPTGQEGLYRRSDMQEYLSGVPMQL